MNPLARPAPAALLLATAVSVHAAPLDGARQLIVVTSEGWDSTQGQLQAYVRDGQGWHPHGQAFPVALGPTGSAWGRGLHPAQADGPQKQEGDGRSPAGIFALGSAFGYAVTRRGTAMPHQPMLDSSYCLDVPGSPLYNPRGAPPPPPSRCWTAATAWTCPVRRSTTASSMKRRSAMQRSRAPPSRCG